MQRSRATFGEKAALYIAIFAGLSTVGVIIHGCATAQKAGGAVVAVVRPCADQVTAAERQDAVDAVFTNADPKDAKAALTTIGEQVGLCVARALFGELADELAKLTGVKLAAPSGVTTEMGIQRLQSWLAEHAGDGGAADRSPPRGRRLAGPRYAASSGALRAKLQEVLGQRPSPFIPASPRRAPA
jgi:hypothetical protein